MPLLVVIISFCVGVSMLVMNTQLSHGSLTIANFRYFFCNNRLKQGGGLGFFCFTEVYNCFIDISASTKLNVTMMLNLSFPSINGDVYGFVTHACLRL